MRLSRSRSNFQFKILYFNRLSGFKFYLKAYLETTYVDSEFTFGCTNICIFSDHYAKNFSLKSLMISDYHFINPIKNPTKKMTNPKYHAKLHRATVIYA